jgi:3-deoxy-D-manno-octulosonic-acid transferase
MTFALRALYSILMWLLLPSTLFYLVWRGLKQSAYLERWSERFALYAVPGESSCIWLHAVSVGEFNAVIPLLQQLRLRYPDQTILITTTTPTGSARVKQIFKDDVRHVYLPYDTPGAVQHFYEHFNPVIGLIVETELWVNLYRQAALRNIPLLIVNGRISPKSMQSYQPLKPLMKLALRDVQAVLAQSVQDGERFVELGLPREHLQVPGNLKFDIAPPEVNFEWQTWQSQNNSRKVWIAASTHPDEHAIILDAHAAVKNKLPDALLIIAPRHPEAFVACKALVGARGWYCETRSEHQTPSSAASVFVLDSLGELVQMFAITDVAFIGGSFVDVGGHNVLEPAVQSVPVLIGPYTYNFTDSVELLKRHDACQQVNDAVQLTAAVLQMLTDPVLAKQRGEAGLQAMLEARGALQKTLTIIGQTLTQREFD